ncbi:MAG: DUF433 domain-containing protein [Xenococcaceae cyanobacterium]
MKELIISNPQVMVGKSVIKGTRITVEHILKEMANGLTIEELLDSYPNLTREGIQAALKFAAKSVRHEVIYPISTS